ncbi:hypothetical protein CEXT_487341 [Caerostris extrusa]|uniref:Uncharacterized protein n=1 Tax=Caerostris extrusa TaxID=172846 RepID=A0AAV4XB32_CAEEX|nr:hypothetical protein CEXT_487341 [Caerostris extrusa]
MRDSLKYRFSHFRTAVLSSSGQLKACDKLLDSSHSLFESLVIPAVYPRLDKLLQLNIQSTGQKSYSVNNSH